MSIELHVLLFGAAIPDRRRWQEAIDLIGLPVVLDNELDLPVTTGFRPCIVSGQPSGFEISLDAVPELLAQYQQLQGNAANARIAVSFRFGGDLGECACALAAAAGLLKICPGVAYSPDDDVFYTPEALEDECRQCLSSA